MKRPAVKKQESEETKDERVTVSIRNISQRKWKAFQKKAKAEGKFLWSAMESMIDDYLRKK